MDNINGTISGGEFLHEGMMLLQTISNLPFFRKHVRSRVFTVRNESLSEGRNGKWRDTVQQDKSVSSLTGSRFLNQTAAGV